MTIVFFFVARLVAVVRSVVVSVVTTTGRGRVVVSVVLFVVV